MGLLGIKSITSQSIGDIEMPLETFAHIQKETATVTTHACWKEENETSKTKAT